MKQFAVSLLSLFLIIACSSGDNTTSPQPQFNEISGPQSGVLTRGQSPYLVTDTLIVEANTTLTIDAGVRLLFETGTMMIVKGRLESIGTAVRVIAFVPRETDWLGIKFVDAQPSEMKFTLVEGVRINRPDSLQLSAVEVLRSELTLQNSIIRDNFSRVGGGLYASAAIVTLENNIFRDNMTENLGGALFCERTTLTFINNTVFDNISINIGGGLVLDNQVASDIQNNIFFENSGTAGDPRITIVSGDSTNSIQQFNFLQSGNLVPGFISNDDLHLTETSQAVDMGNPDSQFNDVDGTRNDQGAYGGPLGNW